MRARVSRIRGAAAALAATLMLAGPLFAQEAGTAAVAAKADAAAASAGTCTFDVIDQPIDKVLEYVRRASGTNIVVAQEAMNDRVTLQVRSMNWRSALEEIARRSGCTVEEMADYLRVEKPPRVSFSFEQADISKVIRTIAALASANIVADPDDVKGIVTVNLIDVPWTTRAASCASSRPPSSRPRSRPACTSSSSSARPRTSLRSWASRPTSSASAPAWPATSRRPSTSSPPSARP
jgi:type II secretory pathway component GspD/PulD (secretin)